MYTFAARKIDSKTATHSRSKSWLFAALSLFLAGCGSGSTPSLHLEAAAGTYTQQRQLGSSEVAFGTALIVKLRTSRAQAATMTLTGPESWNGGAPYTFTYPAGSDWVVVAEAEVPPVEGEYRLEASVGEERVVHTVKLNSISEKLGLTNITATLNPQTETPTAEVKWAPVPNAKGYFARLFDAETGMQAVSDIYTTQTEARFDVSARAESVTYVAAVYSATVDTVSDDPPLPDQFHLSDSIAMVERVGTEPDEPETLALQSEVKDLRRPSIITRR